MKKRKIEESISSFKKFGDKYKSDSKFNAKVQLFGYVFVFLLIVIYANVISLNGTKKISNTTSSRRNSSRDTIINSGEKHNNLLRNSDNNYEYDIRIFSKVKGSADKRESHYYGKVYKNNMEILKDFNDTVYTYYKVDSHYYKRDYIYTF